MLLTVEKYFFEFVNLANANKTKQSIISQKLGSQKSPRVSNIVFNKDKYVMPLLFDRSELLFSTSDRINLYTEILFTNSNH